MLPVLDGRKVFPVLPTAGIVQFMELACRKLIEPYLGEGEEAVGVEVSVKHLAACGVGKTVTATAELAEYRHGRARFHVVAFDGDRLLATGVHIHRILPKERVQRAFQAGS